eukprot:Blabericola_migrator_1__12055@NODE_741_length_6682_cov_71_114588_g531_i0_p6_GENE_NODE_741_length_6682_cov_71_114588_g531_i0NODE_741_length_6682_cov_71_114588_g531_i0_p6_ORF_typecomplete_len214_score26_74PDEase_I/PF00233_19/2_8e30T6SS_VasE/PF05936_12/0_019_NODE_741_length_6682_cov_71_114588_g531_i028973538
MDLFQNMSLAERVGLRKLDIQLVLSTDMGKHYELLSLARVRRSAPDFQPAMNESDRILALTMVLKMADLYYCVIDWSHHLEWTLRRCEENYQQGDHELLLGLPISPLCDRAAHQMFPKLQSGFLQWVALPLVEEVMSFGASQELGLAMVAKLLFNKHQWDTLKEAGKTEEIPREVRHCKIAHPFFLPMCIVKCLTGGSLDAIVRDDSHMYSVL